MKTDLTELPESRVRLEVAIEPEVVAKRMDRAAKQLANEIKMPGFRKGKVPPQLVIQRLGREAVLEQAVRDSLAEWYEEAIVTSGVVTVGDPKLDVDDLPAEGEGLEFKIEIGVRPKAELGDYKDLEVGRAEIDIPEDAIAEELERLREGFGSLNPVERPAAEGDVAVIDYEGFVDGEPFEGGSGTAMSVEIGSERLLPEFEAGLLGKSAGEEADLDVTFPEGYGAEHLAGKAAVFKVKVNEIREKDLPALDDDFAQSASEFDTLEELREEIRSRMAEILEQRSDMEFRDAAVEAAAENATIDLPHDLIHARAHELWERFERTLAARGIDPQMYAQMQGKDRHAMIDEGQESAEKTLRREATLAAVAEAEAIDPTDEELIEALGPPEGSEKPEKALARLREKGRDGLLREEVRLRKAAALIADSAKPIALAKVEARDAIWTPESGEAVAPDEGGGDAEGAEPGKLWTPGS
ncbi:MAG: trigger factor [Actinomycetota bacterium]|nr:trigger factor [Actinomycetota bacterium]